MIKILNNIKNIMLKYIVLAIPLIVITLVIFYLLDTKPLKINSIVLSGNNFLDKNDLENVVKDYLNNKNFFQLDLNELRQIIVNEDFIAKTKIYTKDISNLHIEIQEINPIGLIELNQNIYFIDKNINLIEANYKSINHFIGTPIITNLSNNDIDIYKISNILKTISIESENIYDIISELRILNKETMLVLNNNTDIVFSNKNIIKELQILLEFNKQIIIKNQNNINDYQYIDLTIPKQVVINKKI